MSKVLQTNIARCDQKCQRKSAGFFFAVCFRGVTKVFFTKLFTYFFQLEPGKIVVWARVFAWLWVKENKCKKNIVRCGQKMPIKIRLFCSFKTT